MNDLNCRKSPAAAEAFTEKKPSFLLAHDS